MHIATILPHTLLYGGVKRFLELGNIFFGLGHKVTIYTPTGQEPQWYNFNGEVKDFSSLQEDKIDALFFTETEFVDIALAANAKKCIFYYVYPKENLRIIKKHPNILVFANSTNLVETALKRYKINAIPAFGGVNLEYHNPKNNKREVVSNPFTVMAYGRIARSRKGTKYVIKACEKLFNNGHNIELLLFDTPVNDKMEDKNSKFKTFVPHSFIQNHPVQKNSELFHKANVFVSAEKNAGWANTAAEAMACEIPVIGTESGTRDFLFHEKTGLIVSRNSNSIYRAILRLKNNPEYSIELAQNGRRVIENFTWENLAQRILQQLL